MSREGRKIDEFQIQKRSAVLRMDQWHNFTVEVDGLSFQGKDVEKLKRDAELAVLGVEKAEWEPVVVLDASPGDLDMSFKRFFCAEVGGKTLYRAWMVDGKTEPSRWKCGDSELLQRTDGEPGDIVAPHIVVKERELPYTAGFWTALVALRSSIEKAVSDAQIRLADVLRKDPASITRFSTDVRRNLFA